MPCAEMQQLHFSMHSAAVAAAFLTQVGQSNDACSSSAADPSNVFAAADPLCVLCRIAVTKPFLCAAANAPAPSASPSSSGGHGFPGPSSPAVPSPPEQTATPGAGVDTYCGQGPFYFNSYLDRSGAAAPDGVSSAASLAAVSFAASYATVSTATRA